MGNKIYPFLLIDGLYETAEIVGVSAGCTDDAYELVNELETNNAIAMALTPNILEALKKLNFKSVHGAGWK